MASFHNFPIFLGKNLKLFHRETGLYFFSLSWVDLGCFVQPANLLSLQAAGFGVAQGEVDLKMEEMFELNNPV